MLYALCPASPRKKQQYQKEDYGNACKPLQKPGTVFPGHGMKTAIGALPSPLSVRNLRLICRFLWILPPTHFFLLPPSCNPGRNPSDLTYPYPEKSEELLSIRLQKDVEK